MDEPRRILVVRLSHLGDVVQALPLFHALRGRFPEARLAWAVQPEYAGLLEGLPGLERVVPFERRGGWRAWPRFARAARAFAPDLVVDAQTNVKSAACALASGARERVSLPRALWREPLAARTLTRAVAAPAAPLPHAQDRVLHLARELCGPFEPRRDPALRADELAAGRRLLTELVGPADAPVVVQVGPAGDVRTPPDELLAGAVRGLAATGRAVVVTGAPSEAARAASVAERAGAPARTALRTSAEGLRSFAAWLAAAAERGGALVSADTGPLHLAAAVGLRCVCLSGPFDPARTGPWPPAGSAGSPHVALVAEPDLECRPCLARSCARPRGRACLERITPERVVAAVLDARPRGPARSASGAAGGDR